MLGNEGVIKVLQGTSVAKTLKKIWLGDNQFNDEEDVLKAIMFCWVKNVRLGKYDFKHNILSGDGKYPSFDQFLFYRVNNAH